MEKKKCSGIKIAVRVTVFILLLGIFSVTGYEMYSTALEKKSVSEMAADIKSRCRFAEYSELPIATHKNSPTKSVVDASCSAFANKSF